MQEATDDRSRPIGVSSNNGKGNHVLKRILLLVACFMLLAAAGDPAGPALVKARQLFNEKHYEEARQAYEAALASDLCDPVRRDVLLEPAA